MDEVGKNVRDGVLFVGIAFEQVERAQLVRQLPNDGLDSQDAPVHWVLPDGRCISWSVRYLATAREDELVHVSAKTRDEAYNLVAKVLGYETLGMALDDDVAALRAEPGALQDQAWNRFKWHRPDR